MARLKGEAPRRIATLLMHTQWWIAALAATPPRRRVHGGRPAASPGGA